MALSALAFSALGIRDPILGLVRDPASVARKAEASFRLDLYNDHQADAVMADLAGRFADISKFQPVFVNLIRRVITKRATVYIGEPVRTFEGVDADLMADIYDQAMVDIVLKQASRLAKLHKTTAIRVAWDAERGQPRIYAVPASILDAEWDDPWYPTRMVETRVTGTGPQDVSYSEWTDKTFRRFSWNGQPLPTDGNARGVNPFAVVPYVPVFDAAPSSDFWLPGGDDLVRAQRALNALLTELLRTLELQGFGQPWATGVPPGDILRAGPDRVLTLPDGGSFGFAAPETPTDGILKAAEFLLKQTALANSLPGNSFETDPKVQSGTAKSVEERDLIEARADDIALFKVVERRLFELMKRVVNTYRPGTIAEGASLVSVDFAELDRGETDADRLDGYQRRIDLGLYSPVDAFIADSGGDITSREEALAALQLRREESAALGAPFAGPSFPSQTPGELS